MAMILCSSISRMCCLTPCTPVFATVIPPWKNCLCWYATKRRKVSDIIRWNTENKLLFGSKQRMTAGRKSPVNNTAAEIKNAQTETMRLEESVDDVIKHRLEEMYMESVSEGMNVVSRPRADEQKFEKGSIAGSDKMFVKQDFQAQIFGENNEKLKESENRMFPTHSLVMGSDVDIPKILPISRGKEVSALRAKQPWMLKSTGESSSTTPFQPKGVDFVLQCPLFPDQLQVMPETSQQFLDLVESFGLRFLPTVNTVLNKTRSDLSNFFLQRWREKMIKELGEVGFKKHQEATIWQGINLHACVQQYLSGVPPADIQVQESNRGHWDSISTVLPDVSEVQALETSISHPFLCYKGTFDCIAKYKNTLCVIDWKTSSKPKPLMSNLYDNPLQVVAYLGAINLSANFTSKIGVIDHAAIIVAYPNGEAAHVHRIQPALCQHFWAQWCQRLHQYWTTVATDKLT